MQKNFTSNPMDSFSALEKRLEHIQKRGKILTNQDLYNWIEWNYGKKRWWTDKYIRPHLRWKELKTRTFPYIIIGKYLSLDELKSQIKNILGDYGL